MKPSSSPFASPRVDIDARDRSQPYYSSLVDGLENNQSNPGTARGSSYKVQINSADNSNPSTDSSNDGEEGEVPIQAVRRTLNPISVSRSVSANHAMPSNLMLRQDDVMNHNYQVDMSMAQPTGETFLQPVVKENKHLEAPNAVLYNTMNGTMSGTMNGTMSGTMTIRRRKLPPVKGTPNRFMFLSLMLSLIVMCSIVLPLGGHGWANSDDVLGQQFLNPLNITTFSPDGSASGSIQSSFFFLTNKGVAATQVGLFETCACLKTDEIDCPLLVRILVGTKALSVTSIILEALIISFLVYEYTHPNHTAQLPRLISFLAGLLTAMLAVTWSLFRAAALTECSTSFAAGSLDSGDVLTTNASLSLPGNLASTFWLKTFEVVVSFILFLGWVLQLTGIIPQSDRIHRILTFSLCGLIIITCSSTTSRGWLTDDYTQMGLFSICSCTPVVEMCNDSGNVFRSASAFAILSVFSSAAVFLVVARIFYWSAPPIVVPMLSVINLLFVIITFAIMGTWFHQSYCGKPPFASIGYLYWSFWIWLLALLLCLLQFLFNTLHYKGYHIPWVHEQEPTTGSDAVPSIHPDNPNTSARQDTNSDPKGKYEINNNFEMQEDAIANRLSESSSGDDS